MEENGAAKRLPTIMVGWDANGQTAHLAFDNTEFKNWDMVIAVLRLATDAAEAHRRLVQMQNLQQIAEAKAQADAHAKAQAKAIREKIVH